MLQAFVITLREGLEAFLIVAISLAYLRKSGRAELRKAVHWGIVAAVAVSAIGGYLLFHAANQEWLEGPLALVAAIVLLTILGGWLLELMLERMSRDRRQKETLRTILNLGTQIIGLLLVLLVIFGTPAQMPTILGLATAGLTVVFQDFILAFCGWFVLMGRNGIKVRDWVEIDGVGGEVAQVGLFRTWLLEMGNWTANGHPTGRKVSFLNGFAIRGKYFNFSTSGQWMWDEIKLSIPPGARSYPLIQKIREAAIKATEADVKMAEEEWKRVTHEEGLPQFTATPSVDLRPAGIGLDIVVRYVTRAGVRLETRNRLFEAAVEILREDSEVPGKSDVAV